MFNYSFNSHIGHAAVKPDDQEGFMLYKTGHKQIPGHFSTMNGYYNLQNKSVP